MDVLQKNCGSKKWSCIHVISTESIVVNRSTWLWKSYIHVGLCATQWVLGLTSTNLIQYAEVANALNRTLVIPPVQCSFSKRWRYCNLCFFGGVNCFRREVSLFLYPPKESIFFSNEMVPQRIRREDMTNPVFSFETNCQPKESYKSGFPAHVIHSHDIKCVPCNTTKVQCAIQFGLKRKESVLKLYAIWCVWYYH